jgi:hypothetical protein
MTRPVCQNTTNASDGITSVTPSLRLLGPMSVFPRGSLAKEKKVPASDWHPRQTK